MDVVIGWMHITESAGVILISHNLVGTRRGRWRTCFVKHSEPFPLPTVKILERKDGSMYVSCLGRGLESEPSRIGYLCVSVYG